MAFKAPKIGLNQAQRLCQMPQSDRLDCISEGLPIILASSRGFWQASTKLEEQLREAVVLARHAEEEAAKVLILMDIVRCPNRIVASRIGDMVKWFYSHLARLIYAEAVSWKPMHAAQLRTYVDSNRKSHEVEGAVGEYIVPNWTILNREGVLYSDIAIYEGDSIQWNNPADLVHDFAFPSHAPTVLQLAEAMSLLGMFTRRGLEVTAATWANTEFRDRESFQEARDLTRNMIERLVSEDLPSEQADQHHVHLLYEAWPLPMYHFDFQLIPVPLEDLKAEQDYMLGQEMGVSYF